MSGPVGGGVQAFPRPGAYGPYSSLEAVQGMTLRQYAAIKLRVPESGDEWLDNMIRASLRNEFAGRALQASIGACTRGEERDALLAAMARSGRSPSEQLAVDAHHFADAMLRSSAGGTK